MKDFFRLLRVYIPPYQKYLWLNFLFNFLSAVFGVFSLVSMVPVLKILFGLEESVHGYLKLSENMSGFDEFSAAVKHNVYSFITQMSETRGADAALIYIGLFLIIMVLLKVGFSYLGSYSIVTLRTSVIRDIRDKIYKKTVSLPIGFFTEERKGDIIARITGDVSEVEFSIMSSLDMFFKNPPIIIVSVITMFIMSWQLTIFVLILFPITGAIIGRIGKSLKKSSLRGQNKMGELLSTIEETLSGLRIIKGFNAEKKVHKRFQKENEDYRKIMGRLLRRRYLAHPLSEFLGTMIIIIVMWYGGHLILNANSSLEPALFIVYLAVFYSVINPVKAFSQEYYSIQKGLASMERINRILEVENNIVEKPDALPIKGFNDSISYSNVYFKYRNEYVLRNININLRKGRTIALVGHSGSGKSTLVDLLPRFYDVEKGQILIDGKDIRDLKLADLRGLMGIVNQDPILFNDTFFSNIAFGVNEATEDEVIAAAKVAHAHEFITATEDGYYSMVGDRGNKLSGGQRQRISIARAVLKNPPVLILDEATSALDTESEKLVQDALMRLMENRTSIVIAHRLSTIIHADEIFVLSNGIITERGTHDQLLGINGEYTKFYNMQYFGA
ncbi:MAG TPA: ABC transporter ATP-binding protein [Bacteroidales bacterium]|jgi:subfamily B ATP-binding cassette protein MsbA|nr:ABC transporter ATP-binding protein [Bacteroidales bacterium]